MKKVDPHIVIKQLMSKEKWDNMKNLPTGNDFKDAFVIHMVTNAQNRTKLVLHCSIVSKLRMNPLKWELSVYNYIAKKKIYINIDFFETLETASPGCFIYLHLILTRKDEFKTYIEHHLPKADGLKKNDVKEWMDENYPGWDGNENPLPKFIIQTTTRKFGNGAGHVETDMLAVEFAAKDAACLKALLIAA
eukprot:7945232-Ditylum_brightwellii.AAC.1